MTLLLILLTLSYFISTILPQTKPPILLALMLVTQVITFSLAMYTSLAQTWYLYILAMIYLSAMMIVFIYVCSLASNQIITPPSYLIITLPAMTFLMFLYYSPTMSPISLEQLLAHTPLFNMTFSQSLYIIYSYPLLNMTIFLMVYLLLTLLVVVKLASSSKKSLRMK
uniref:ND6 protein n=1 Tax=Haploginglymus sp. JP-2016 TaxID=1867951 RepID=A0A330IXX7_9CRUS|nr:ND6 [Haploginglymus sp. JP-2016]